MVQQNKIILIVFFALTLPLLTSAHGGVSKNVGNVVVYLDQTPISPLVGEKVVLDFSLRDLKNQPLINTPVSLTLTDTYYGDESKDKIILKQNATTDNNGDFEFSYTFNKENFFDLDLDFNDPVTKQDDSTGFLIQPRAIPVTNSNKLITIGLISLAMGLIIGFNLKKLKSVSS